MSKLKIAFFGTSDRSVDILEALNANFDLVLCITKKDSLVGRKQEVRQTAVKKWSIRHGIEYIEVDTLKGESGELVAKKMKDKNIDYGIVADFSLMITSSVIEPYRDKLINIHFSLLPKYRGACPVQFAILNGDKTTGITYLLVTEGLDNGPVVRRIGYNIDTKCTSGELYEKLFKLAAENLPGVIQDYDLKKLSPILQDKDHASYTYSRSNPKRTFIYKEDAKIDWTKTADEIERSVRTYNPWPISWTTLGELEDTSLLAEEPIRLKSTVDKAHKVKIYDSEVLEGKLMINTLQIEGKNKMSWSDFVNGYCEKKEMI